MKDIEKKIIEFRDARNWKQFHNAKDLAISISLESSELLELFQWKDSEEALKKNSKKIEEELADILIYCIMLSHDLGINLKEAIENKLELNNVKYPVEKSYGSKSKYTNF